MMDQNTHDQLRALLEDEELPEWQRATRLLSLAFTYCRASLDQTQDRAAQLQGLAALMNAFKAGGAVLGGLTHILQQAGPGVTLRQALEKSRAELVEHQKELDELQKGLAELEKSAKKLEEMDLERQRLRSRLEYLQRLKQMDPQELEALRKQVDDQENGDVVLHITI